jgi:TRAP-type C4-dicarboxylate transport system permease small subunit
VKRLDRIVEWVCEKAVLVCGVLFIASGFYVSAELLARKFLNVSLIGANELSGYVQAVASAWAFSYALLKRSHIRIDAFYRLLPLYWRAVVGLLSSLTMTILVGIYAWYATKYLWFVWTTGVRSVTTLDIPIWLPMLGWDLGLIAFFLVSLYLTIAASVEFLRGSLAAVQARIGSLSEEAEAEFILEEAARGHAEMPSQERS